MLNSLMIRFLVLLYSNGSFSFNLIGFLGPYLSAWVLGDTCPYYNLVVIGQCTRLAFFYEMIESTPGKLPAYHRSIYVPTDCSMSISLTTVHAAIFALASFSLLAQRTNGKERLLVRRVQNRPRYQSINQSINRPL